MRNISESLNHSKQQFKTIIQKKYDENENLSVDKKIDDFTATIEVSMKQIKSRFDEINFDVDKKIEGMTKSINELTKSVNEILQSKKLNNK